MILDRKYLNQNEDIRLPREDSANLIGTAREGLGRLLKEFKEEKLIEIDNKIIRVLDFQKPLKIASSTYI